MYATNNDRRLDNILFQQSEFELFCLVNFKKHNEGKRTKNSVCHSFIAELRLKKKIAKPAHSVQRVS